MSSSQNSTTSGQVKLNAGEIIKGFVVKKKLGEGACGTVYLVHNVRNDKIRGAMKVEPQMKSKDDEILKMEVFVLRKIQHSMHACRMMASGKHQGFSFVVMSLLGKELSELRRRLPDRKIPVGSTLKIAFQCVQALQDLHQVGFLHRDVKPTNFACGHTQKHVIYVFDFGLARQFLLTDKDGKLKLREPRNKVCFRGTVRYCSLNVHHYREQGRHDDLFSMLYMLIELLTATLPWKGQLRREAGHLKETVADAVLLKGCPSSFHEIHALLKKCTYADIPPYDAFREALKKDMKEGKIKVTDPFEWEKEPVKKAGAAAGKKDAKNKNNNDDDGDKSEKKPRLKKADEQAEKERDGPDTDTVRDLDDSVLTEGDDVESQTKGLAKEDTLDGVVEMSKHT